MEELQFRLKGSMGKKLTYTKEQISEWAKQIFYAVKRNPRLMRILSSEEQVELKKMFLKLAERDITDGDKD